MNFEYFYKKTISMKIITPLLIIILFYSCSSSKYVTQHKVEKSQSFEESKNLLTELADDKYLGREPGTEGFNKASEFVQNYITELGIQPFFENGYKDTLTIYGDTTWNIVGLIGDRNNGKDFIVISAHLDHLGYKKTNKKYPNADTIFNGANDNASGVVCVMQMAKVLSKYKFNKNIIIVFYTGEEKGLKGSKHLAKKLKKANIPVVYALNYDMIGAPYTDGPNTLYITGYKYSNLAEEVNKALGQEVVKYFEAEDDYHLVSRSDNYPLMNTYKIPSHTFITFKISNFKHYHEVSDEVIVCDIENMHSLINLMTFATIKLLRENTELVLTSKNKAK